MPFGITNSPSNKVLSPFNGLSVVNNKDEEEHINHLRKIFLKLRGKKLLAKIEKREFVTSSVCSWGSLYPKIALVKSKLEAIKSWPVPNSITEVRNFHGYNWLLFTEGL